METDTLSMARTLEADTLAVMFEQFKLTIALMYKALLHAEPMMSRQMEIFLVLQQTSNLLLFVCFLVVAVVLIKIHMETQNAKKFWNIKIKKKWLIILIATFSVALGIINIYPGYLLSKMEKEATNDVSLKEAQERLFGFDERLPPNVGAGEDDVVLPGGGFRAKKEK